MKDALRHRGPDGSGAVVCEPTGRAGLAHSRLAVIDLHTGDQPMCNEDGTVWVTFNGEIYNYRELRRELEGKGHLFKSDADTETLVHLYEEMGEDCVTRLVGMFAFAVWDEPRGELLLARDRLGQKPLYWTVQNHRLYFASESGAILSLPGLSRELDPVAMDYYLRLWYIPAPRSIRRGMRQLPPATTMTWRWSHGQRPVREHTYWRPPPSPGFAGSEEDACEELRRALCQVVRDRTISDVPLGVFLSGGLDSTILVSVLAEVEPGPLRTFSLGFPEAQHNELPFARQAATHFDTDHTEFVLDSTSMDDLERLASVFDEPFGDSSALPTYKLSQCARSDIVVALTGEAGDENFGGYLRYGPLAGIEPRWNPGDWWRHACFGRLMEWRCHWRVTPLKERLMYSLCRPADLYFRLMSVFSDASLARLYTPEAAERVGDREARDWFCGLFDKGAGHGVLGAAMYTDLLSYLPGDLNTKLDRASMAVALEARSPFQDHRLVEFACSLPAAWKMRRGPDGTLTGKYLLKKAFRDRIPPSLWARPKMGFALPLKHWFAGPWAEFTRGVLLDSGSLRRNIFRRRAVERLIEDHVRGRRDHSQRLWQLLFLELWMRHHVDARPGAECPRASLLAEPDTTHTRVPQPATA